VIAVAIVALLGAIAPGDARADDRKARAAALFAEAQAAEARREWRAAIDAYRAAYELAPHPSVLYNIALDQERLEEYRNAATSFLRYLDLLPRAADRDRVLARVRALQQRPSRVTVASRPDGARVLVNGDDRGRAPLTLTMEGGVRSWIVAELDGRRSPRQSVWVEYGEPLVLTLDLEQQGTLRVISNVPAAQVAVDGRSIGLAPLEAPVAAGSHLVVVSRPGYRAVEQRVEIAADGSHEVHAELIPLTGGGPSTGYGEGPPSGETIGVTVEGSAEPPGSEPGAAFLVGAEYGLARGSFEYAVALGAGPAPVVDVMAQAGLFDGDVGLGGEVRVYLARGGLRPFLRGGAVHRFRDEAGETDLEAGGGVLLGGASPGPLGFEYFLQVSARRAITAEDELVPQDDDDEDEISFPVVLGVQLRLGS
jgi:hypothetical protein